MKCTRNRGPRPFVLLRFLVAFIFLNCIASFAAEDQKVGEAVSAPAALTRVELENAIYTGFDGNEEIKGPVRLVNGKWEGTPYRKDSAVKPVINLLGDFIITGDLDGDGSDEAVTLISLNTGGTGQLVYIAVVRRCDGEVKNIATKLIGDRVQIRGGKIKDRSIVIDIVRAGPSDPACCPGEVATIGWALEPGGVLNPVTTADKPKRLSLKAIEGTEWVLGKWSWNEPAQVEPEITLLFLNGQFIGRGGCNRYFAAAKEGEMAGDISVGQVGSTRMFCNEMTMAVENRFFTQLSAVKKFGFMLGKLALTYQMEGVREVMLFEERTR